MVHIDKLNITSDTVVLSKKKHQPKPTVELLLKIHKLSEDEIKRAKKLLVKRKPKAKIKIHVSKTKPKIKTSFSLTSHGVKKCKHNYTYKCKVRQCRETFPNIKLWNRHHLKKHARITFPCAVCGKIRLTPSSTRIHQYTHKMNKLTCRCCNREFNFPSELTSHMNLHHHQKIHTYFYPGCNKTYQWPQDLHRHVKCHVGVVKTCKLCTYLNTQARLLKQHWNVHTDDLPFACRKCGNKYKHAMQHYRHEKECAKYCYLSAVEAIT